jgi:hypothetical protein
LFYPEPQKYQRNNHNKEHPRNFRYARGPLKYGIALHAPNFFFATAAPKQGHKPPAKNKYPRVNVPPQNSGRLNFLATASRTRSLVSSHR